VTSIGNAYTNRIKALHEHRVEQVDNVLMRILNTSPLDALRQLKSISDEVEQNLSASAMAEGGDFESAKNMRPKKEGYVCVACWSLAATSAPMDRQSSALLENQLVAVLPTLNADIA
jgi:hypothetical protein